MKLLTWRWTQIETLSSRTLRSSVLRFCSLAFVSLFLCLHLPSILCFSSFSLYPCFLLSIYFYLFLSRFPRFLPNFHLFFFLILSLNFLSVSPFLPSHPPFLFYIFLFLFLSFPIKMTSYSKSLRPVHLYLSQVLWIVLRSLWGSFLLYYCFISVVGYKQLPRNSFCWYSFILCVKLYILFILYHNLFSLLL